MKEIWKDIKGYDGDYQVSNLGKVKSLKKDREKILKHSNNNGYCLVCLYKNKKTTACSVHQLVYYTFNDVEKTKDFVIDHINRDKSDNRLENLRLVTQRKNTQNREKKFKGYVYNKKSRTYRSVTDINNKQICLINIKEKNTELLQKSIKLVEENISKFDGDYVKFVNLIRLQLFKEYNNPDIINGSFNFLKSNGNKFRINIRCNKKKISIIFDNKEDAYKFYIFAKLNSHVDMTSYLYKKYCLENYETFFTEHNLKINN